MSEVIKTPEKQSQFPPAQIREIIAGNDKIWQTKSAQMMIVKTRRKVSLRD